MTHSSFGTTSSPERLSSRIAAIEGLFDEGAAECSQPPSSAEWQPAEADYLDTELPVFQIDGAKCEILKVNKRHTLWGGCYVEVESEDYGAVEYLIFTDYDQALYATAQYWLEMMDYDTSEFLCLAGDDPHRIVEWVKTLEDCRKDYTLITHHDTPESCFGAYDGSYSKIEAYSIEAENLLRIDLADAIVIRTN